MKPHPSQQPLRSLIFQLTFLPVSSALYLSSGSPFSLLTLPAYLSSHFPTYFSTYLINCPPAFSFCLVTDLPSTLLHLLFSLLKLSFSY